MLRWTRRWLQDSRFQQVRPDGRKFNPKVQKEVGAWLYTKEGMEGFQQHCSKHHVKARGTVKIAGSSMYSRALRATREINPGEAIVTMPLTCGFNFLTVARLMYDVPNTMPLQVNWMNWNERLSMLPGAATHEFVTAGWMVRVNSLAEEPYAKYVHWILQDTCGREGIASGIGQDRGDNNTRLDSLLTTMSADACEEGEDYLESFFRSYAALMHRTVPLESWVTELYLPGTNFFKAKVDSLFVPTLFPLLDCLPQTDSGFHNTMVEFVKPSDYCSALWKELELQESDVITDDNRSAFKDGFLVLRALECITEGNYLTMRSWPKTGDHENERISNAMLESTRQMSNDVANY